MCTLDWFVLTVAAEAFDKKQRGAHMYAMQEKLQRQKHAMWLLRKAYNLDTLCNMHSADRRE